MHEANPDSGETLKLLKRIRAGSPAFDALFERHRESLRQAVALRFDPVLRARVDPSDVVQEAQMEAFRRLPDYLARQPMPFHLWLRKMAQERLIMARRKHVVASCRAVGHELPLPSHSSVVLAQQVLASGGSPSQPVIQEELVARVRQAISELPDNDREMLLMRTYEGLSYDEIACVLEIEPTAARKRYGRALIRLHKLLTQDGLSESQL
jgi:RNA polymerase sigma-70 factor (ECF subfamily)